MVTQQRRFLFLQGPHGPFFQQLSQALSRAGAQVWRVGFNKGDEVFWRAPSHYIAHPDGPDAWPEHLDEILAEHEITDLVVYGDTRPIHAKAVARARDLGLRVHVFEEGYLRPYWVTYERGGANGHSKLMDMSIEQIRTALVGLDHDSSEAPAHWGDMRHHIFYGMLYHFFVLFWNAAYAGFTPHRHLGVLQEFRLYLGRLVFLPLSAMRRAWATRSILNSGAPYHMCLLQLEHDASFQSHSRFARMSEFVDVVVDGFAKGAPGHHHLVFKAHPLEDGRGKIRLAIANATRRLGVEDRVHYVRGGKLAHLLNTARSAVTVNSTAAQQVLWRGLPLKVFGQAVYNKPDFVSTQPLAEFFARPDRPDRQAYRDYRHYLLETSQVPGGFYSARGRRQLLRQIPDMMLSAQDPYEALEVGTATPRQQFQVVSRRTG